MSQLHQSAVPLHAATWRDYFELTKPRVVALIMLTSVVGTLLSTPGVPPLDALILGNLGIALAAASAAAINHVLDSRIDARMARTRRRPLPTGHLSHRQALGFALALGVASMTLLVAFVNLLTAALCFCSLIVYAVVYTVWLKRATPQNIVIGGAAGAAPPVLGWVAVTNHVDPHALLLFMIIFAWTPPHFWALAIARRHDYAKVGIPMLPVTHGVELTRLHVLLYTVILCIVTLLPFMTGMSGLIYLIAAVILNARFLWQAVVLKLTRRDELPMRLFRYSITYLMWLFLALLVDHYLRIGLSTQGVCPMRIERIWAANDGRNYHYLIACGETGEALTVDPLNAAAVLEKARELGWDIRQILNTHEHRDHTGGNAEVVAATGASVLAHAAAAARIGGVTRGLAGGDVIRVGRSVELRCLDTPGHTRAHLCLYGEGDSASPALFSGDTLFNAGAGNCLHGGDPQLLFASFNDPLGRLPVQTRVFPGHDYLVRNLGFTLDREPSNEAARELARRCAALGGESMPILTLAEERQINVFFRLASPEIAAGLARAGAIGSAHPSPQEVFLALRELRNRW